MKELLLAFIVVRSALDGGFVQNGTRYSIVYGCHLINEYDLPRVFNLS